MAESFRLPLWHMAVFILMTNLLAPMSSWKEKSCLKWWALSTRSSSGGSLENSSNMSGLDSNPPLVQNLEIDRIGYGTGLVPMECYSATQAVIQLGRGVAVVPILVTLSEYWVESCDTHS